MTQVLPERHFRNNFHETTIHIFCFQATPRSPHINPLNNHKLNLDRTTFIV